MSAEGFIAVAFGTGREVEIEVTEYDYSCCGGGWHPRTDPATYTGRVVSFDLDKFELMCRNDIGGKAAKVSSSFDRLLAVRFVD